MTIHIANRVPETSAGMLRSVQNALGCLDTIPIDLSFVEGDAPNLTGNWHPGVNEWAQLGLPGDTEWYPIGTPDVIGYYNSEVADPYLDFFLGVANDPAKHNYYIHAGE